MPCPHCLSTSTSKRKHRTSLGYKTFCCRDCNKRFNERSGSPFNDLQFPTDIVLLAVLWRLRYKLRFRDVVELLGSVRTQRWTLFLALELTSDTSVLRTKVPIRVAEFGMNLGLYAEF